jgi:hypothetical protein
MTDASQNNSKAAFYRLCRNWHGYLSAVAFVWLLFFAITGILLNHSNWFAAEAPAPTQKQFVLLPGEKALIKAAREPGAVLVDLLRDRLGLRGNISSTDIVGNQLFIRMRGVRGSSDVQADIENGRGSASIEKFAAVTTFKELHRGEQAGPVWQALIDISGAILAATALLGLLIYFAMRLRLATSLTLIGLGLAAMAGGIILFVR